MYIYINPPLPPLSHTSKNCDLVYLQQILFEYSLPASAQAAGLDTPTLAQRCCPWVPAPGEGCSGVPHPFHQRHKRSWRP